jgi:hypothetical protein
MRLSRPCYDKFHRCPGWNGGGPHYARRHRCDDGRIQVDHDARLWKWRFWPCNRCDVVVWPYMTRWLSVFHLAHEARRAAREVAYRWRTR